MRNFILKNVRSFEMLGVLLRIGSFSTMSWLGKDSPFLIIWAVNTLDAILLSYCAILKKDKAYTILNLFWVLVSILGLVRSLPQH